MSAPPVRRPLVLALAGVLVLAGTALPASAAVPDPVVTGPVPATTAPGDPAHGYPFLATDYDLAARGYSRRSSSSRARRPATRRTA